MNKSPRNKTIETSLEDGKIYLDRCLRFEDETAGRNNAHGQSLATLDSSSTKSLINRTICGDMLEACKQIPSDFADLIIADPPYNLCKTFNSENKSHGNAFSRMNTAGYEEYTRNWLQAVEHILKPSGSIYVCCDWESSLIIGKVLGELFTIRNRITWQREKGRGAKANWKNGMEDIWFATKSDEYTFNLDSVKTRRKVLAPYREKGRPKDWQETADGNYRDTCPSNFWDDITIPFWSMAENTAHPTQKPEKLIAKLMLASSNPGGMVFDPFLGSGTTSVAAKKLGRHYLGIEKDEQFCIWAEQRLEVAETDKKIQGYEEGVFWERNAGK